MLRREIQLTFDSIDVDDSLDVANATYNWSVSVDGSNMPVTGDDTLSTVTPTVSAVVAASFTEPTPVVFQLTAGAVDVWPARLGTTWCMSILLLAFRM